MTAIRRFSSYGPIDTDLYYHAPREKLLENGYSQLMGNNPEKGGHYITVWAPRQTGKSWTMLELVKKIKRSGDYQTAIISMEPAKYETSEKAVLDVFFDKLTIAFNTSFPAIEKISEINKIFTSQYFQKPVILIIDEFDSLKEEFINSFAGIFRDMYISRINEPDKKSSEKTILLHSLALIGVRSVLGIENIKGSPFNAQRSLHIPNLTFEEVKTMFQWYEKESGQSIEPAVIERLYSEVNGQPGLTCWFGELLTEGCEFYTNNTAKPITMREFEIVYAAATYALPNNNILNLISKAREPENKTLILKMFQVDEKLPFAFDNPTMNALYMNGLAAMEVVDQAKYYIKFACPFVQKRLFNYFSDEYFNELGKLADPFIPMSDIITDQSLNIPNILKLYQAYIHKNRKWLFKSVPRRSDMRIYEAIFHFNLYAYLNKFIRDLHGQVIPEFPTGNGKIDFIVTCGPHRYGLELKTFSNEWSYRESIKQAAKYGKQLGLSEIYLVVFIEAIDPASRGKFEVQYPDPETGINVQPIFIETGN